MNLWIGIAAATPALPGAADSFAELIRVVLSLAAVVAMIFAVGWLTRRMQSRVRTGGRRMRCVETLAVGAKERVLLLEVGERQLVVGTSPAGLRTLLVLDERLPEPLPGASAERSVPASFREVLTRWRSAR